jgi:WD40 repeat protein
VRAVTDETGVAVFNISRVSPVFRFKGHRDEVNVVKFSPCGTLLASCSDDSTVRIWSLRNIPGLTLSKGGKEKEGEKERFIDEEDNAGVLVLDGHTRDVHTIAWGPWKKGDQGPRLLASYVPPFSLSLPN